MLLPCTCQAKQVRHLDRNVHRFATFVHAGRGGPFERLLDVFDGQHPENDGHTRVQRSLTDTARRLARDEIEMRRVTADDAAQGHDRRIPPAGRQSLRGNGQLEGARHARHQQVARLAAMGRPGLASAAQQAAHNEVVEARTDDRHPQAAGIEAAHHFVRVAHDALST